MAEAVQTDKEHLFDNRALKKMIIPLFWEQLLLLLVGIADTLVISYAGESAVSGVSLVNQFNTVFIFLFTALASGGAVVVSQYIGRREPEKAGESASCCSFPACSRCCWPLASCWEAVPCWGCCSARWRRM